MLAKPPLSLSLFLSLFLSFGRGMKGPRAGSRQRHHSTAVRITVTISTTVTTHSPSWQNRATSAKPSCFEPKTSRLGLLVFCPSVCCSSVWGVSPLPQILHQKILRDRIRNPTEFHCLQDSPNLRGITTGLCVAASLVWLIDGNDVVNDLFTDPT